MHLRDVHIGTRKSNSHSLDDSLFPRAISRPQDRRLSYLGHYLVPGLPIVVYKSSALLSAHSVVICLSALSANCVGSSN